MRGYLPRFTRILYAPAVQSGTFRELYVLCDDPEDQGFCLDRRGRTLAKSKVEYMDLHGIITAQIVKKRVLSF
ncbi:hypothetical protein VN97_g6942 [Penicillium thymicola]|uniref:Uncharacterized protein n=1 Tax=Penicillium thymicola TaxID=293382 RepID=A0AAI9TH91_PENTH|nr:hypothetical protein VN97_g6942 [Penicillium thymicola]